MEYIIDSSLTEVVNCIKESTTFKKVYFEKDLSPNCYCLYYKINANSQTYFCEVINEKVHVHFFITEMRTAAFSYKNGLPKDYYLLEEVLKTKNITYEIVKEVKPKKNPWDGWID